MFIKQREWCLTRAHLHLVWECDVSVQPVILLRDLNAPIVHHCYGLHVAITEATILVISFSPRRLKPHDVQR